MAEVHTQTVNMFLKSMVHAAGYRGADKYIWLGLNDIAEEGSFVWDSTQQPPSFTDWLEGEPNDRRNIEDCAMHMFLSGEEWNDTPCTSEMRSICQLR